MEIFKEIVVDKPIEEAWDVLGNQFSNAYKWARGLDHSKGYGQPIFEGASCNNRTCEVPGFGTIQEEIRMFDHNNHVLSYEVVKGFPGFISSAINTWKLEELGNGTKVSMHLKMETKGIMGIIMGPMMKMKLNKTIEGVIKDFKHYVEKGIPSPEKEKELLKLSKKAA